MEYFDKLNPSVERAFAARAVDINELLYCVKADIDFEGKFVDVYITFDKENLYLMTGYDRLVKNKKTFNSDFDFVDFTYHPLSEIKELYVDRYQYTARLMAKDNDEKEFALARFSLGFGEKFEKFCKRFNCTKNNEEIDDSGLADENPCCSLCGRQYPDPNRKFCPYCTKRSSIFKRLLGMFGDFKVQTIVILSMMLFSVGLGLVAPYFGTSLLYDDVLKEGGSLYGEILYVVLVMASFQLLSTIFTVVYGIVIAHITPRVVDKLRTGLFAAMGKLSLSFFTSKQTSSLMMRVDRDSLDIYSFFTNIVPDGLANLIKITGLVILMLMVNWVIALCMFAVVFVTLLLELIWIRGQHRNWRNSFIARSKVNSVIGDALNGHRVVKAFANEKHEKSRFTNRNDNLYDAEYVRDRRNAQFTPVQRGLYSFANAVLYCFGVYLVLTGQLKFGGLMLLINYFGTMFDPMFFFFYVGNDWARCVDAASRMFEILDSEPTVKPPKSPATIPDGQLSGDIVLKDVSFEYEAGRPIIKNLNIHVEAGQFFGIVGRTGAGKSTIINLISRMYDVTNGEISIDGVAIKDISFEDFRRNIGVVSQETYLFMGTIADNIRYSRPEATMEDVIEAAKSANAHDFIMKLPDGYDTVTGSGGVDLSGGEKQRISIARALIQKPNILILDEATAAMDTRTERKIQMAIDNLKKGRTIISIAHRLSTLRDADVLCVIDNGELKEIGTHDNLIREKGKYFELYKLQSSALKTIGVE